MSSASVCRLAVVERVWYVVRPSSWTVMKVVIRMRWWGLCHNLVPPRAVVKRRARPSRSRGGRRRACDVIRACDWDRGAYTPRAGSFQVDATCSHRPAKREGDGGRESNARRGRKHGGRTKGRHQARADARGIGRQDGRRQARPAPTLSALSPLVRLSALRYKGRIAAALSALVLASLATSRVPLAVRRVIDYWFSDAQWRTLISAYFGCDSWSWASSGRWDLGAALLFP